MIERGALNWEPTREEVDSRHVRRVAAIVVAVYAVGARLPRDHLASVRAHFHQPPDSIYHALVEVVGISHVARGGQARRTVARSGRPSDMARDGELRRRGFLGDGHRATQSARHDDREYRSRIRRSVDLPDPPDSVGTTVSITEEGTVDNPFFRFLSRYVFGLHASMEGLLTALGRRFGRDGRYGAHQLARVEPVAGELRHAIARVVRGRDMPAPVQPHQ